MAQSGMGTAGRKPVVRLPLVTGLERGVAGYKVVSIKKQNLPTVQVTVWA